MAALVEEFIKQPVVLFVVDAVLRALFRAGRAAGAGSLLLPQNRGHVLHVVAERNRHGLRFLLPVAPLQLRDFLRDRRSVFRQRAPANPVQLQLIQRLTRFRAQLQPADGDVDFRFTVPPQPPVGPGQKAVLRRFAVVRLNLVPPAVNILVLAHVFAGDPQPARADRIKPRVHAPPVHRALHRRKVPPAPHLAGYSRIPFPNVQHERENGKVIRPNRVLQRFGNILQRVQQRLFLEFIWVADRIFKVPQCPNALLAQQVLDRLPRGHFLFFLFFRLRFPAVRDRFFRFRVRFKQVNIVKRLYGVLKLDVSRFLVENVPHALNPPHNHAFRHRVPNPVVNRNIRPVRAENDRRRARPLCKDRRVAFRFKPFAPRQAMSNQFIHLCKPPAAAHDDISDPAGAVCDRLRPRPHD